MDFQRLHDGFHAEFGLARDALAAAEAKAPVPSCPEWTATDLTYHLAEVYLHKAECIRRGTFPEPWPPEHRNPDPIAALDEGAVALEEQFVAHSPTDHAPTWYRPDQTVGFWLRRMTHETAIHRVDAQLAAEAQVAPIAADLALDGIDEFLKIFMAYGSVARHDVLEALLDSPDQHTMLISTEETDQEPARAWTLAAHPDGVTVRDARPDEPAAALTVFGRPTAVLCWLWNRPDTDPDAVHIAGDPLLLAQFKALRHALSR